MNKLKKEIVEGLIEKIENVTTHGISPMMKALLRVHLPPLLTTYSQNREAEAYERGKRYFLKNIRNIDRSYYKTNNIAYIMLDEVGDIDWEKIEIQVTEKSDAKYDPITLEKILGDKCEIKFKVDPISGTCINKPPEKRVEEKLPLDQMSQEGRDNYFHNLGMNVAIANAKVLNKRYEEALDYIALVAMKQECHPMKFNTLDTECIFCLAYLALNDGAYGKSFDYKALAEEMRKRPPFTTDTISKYDHE